MKRLSAVVLVFVWGISFADQLEVRRAATIYAAPDRHATVVSKIEIRDTEGPYLLRLIDDKPVNGYYHVRLRGERRDGWIYKTYVRRFKDQHPSQIPYARSLYKHWIDEDSDCQDTRVEILVRDAKGPVQFADSKNCTVKSGRWVDPYTGKTFTDPRQLDVDHVVPLKNAHESGAWTWSQKRRQEYANYLRNDYHLLAVMASENRKKGEKGPDRYMPPRQEYRCEYAKIWVKIKQDWELEMTEAEGEAVQNFLQSCN